MRKTLITLFLGSSLAVLPLSNALGNEGTGSSATGDIGWKALPLPPVPHLDTIEWLSSGRDLWKPNVLDPQSDTLSPFLIDPDTPTTRFSSSEKGFHSSFE
jgi:hypothetical protein